MPGAREGQYAPGGAIAVGVEVAPQAAGTPVWLEPAIDSLRGRSRRYRQAKQDQVFRAPVRHRGGEQVRARVRPREQEQIDQRPHHRRGPEHYLGLAGGGTVIMPHDGRLQPLAAGRESRLAGGAQPGLVPHEDDLGHDGQSHHHQQRCPRRGGPLAGSEMYPSGNHDSQPCG